MAPGVGAVSELPAPRRPPAHWDRVRDRRLAALGHEGWTYGGMLVITEVDVMEAPDGSGEVIPQWHISVSLRGRARVTDADLDRARRAFGMDGASWAEEDNHHPGVARHLFLPVDPGRRVDCECKATEIQRLEPDGYRWSDDPESCRGCELERITGRACPRHRPAAPGVGRRRR